VSSQPGSGSHTPLNGDGRLAPPFIGHPNVVSDMEAATSSDAERPWDVQSDEEEGTVEPVFEADVSEAEAVLAELSRAASAEEFPLDAFIIPEHAHRVPTGLEGKPRSQAPAHTPVTELADRLEKLSHRLRVEESGTLIARLATGDRIDTLLAGLLAGYLASTK
jgi:hypothetical protein